MPSNPSSKKVDALKHTGATRKNIPTAELQSAAQRAEEMQPVKPVTYDRRFPLASGEVRERDGDLDPQIIWKGTKIRLTPQQIEQLAKTGEVDIGEEHLHAMRGHGLGDARTHLARTDNGDCIDHDCFILATATIALH